MSEEITTREEYYPNGNIWFRRNYKHGKLHSLCEWWYKNGSIESRENFKDGKRHGLCEWWWSDGTLEFRNYYFNGKQVTEFEFDVLETCGEF